MTRQAWTTFLDSLLPEDADKPRRPVVKHAKIHSTARPRQRRKTAAALLAEIAGARGVDAQIPPRQIIPVTPVPKPRMSQRDRWSKRPCVLRYRAFCDELRARQAKLPHRYALVLILPMPKSWSDAKRSAMDGQPHLRRPDLSNIQKAIEDALVPHDECLWNNRGIKLWGQEAAVIILRQDVEGDESDVTLVARALGYAEG